MERSQHETPFDELRQLVQQLRDCFDSSDERATAVAANVSEVFGGIDDWIALAEQRRYQSGAIVESACDAFVSMNSAGEIMEWNKQAERTFGWSKADVIGRPVVETIIPADQRDAHRAGVRKFLETGKGTVGWSPN